MAQKNMPPAGKDTTGTNPTDRRTNETGDAGNADRQPGKEGAQRDTAGPQMGTRLDRGNASFVHNPGRDITTGGTGGDGTSRDMPNSDAPDGSTKPACDEEDLDDSDLADDAAEIEDEQEGSKA
ncbi:MAG: hypothetical protein KA175_05215 [Flavobacteriales bacterium]|nr:hypothetical protein [Flavobacteriales bacterium]MBP6696994.1 hypothetical protein [Flavobacteriales bacterium]